MCGIAGVIQQGLTSSDWRKLLEAMTRVLVHRGPDDGGFWVDKEAGIGLGHRRLSIIDLSPTGKQPMLSVCGRYVVSFNGEIYNFLELRQELEQLRYAFRGHSDTEVLLAAVSQWGLEKALGRFNGMFAFAIWDRQEQTLSLVRDRLGEKPLYYGQAGHALAFASELKAMKTLPGFKAEIDRDALALLLRYGYIPAPHCIYAGVRKLPPGTLLTVRAGEGWSGPVPYWSLEGTVTQGMADPFHGSEGDAIAHLDGLLKDAVKLRLVADVPLGAFLSGGIDSSTIVAMMQAQSSRPVKTFSIGFREGAYDEAAFARRVARHLGTDHTELYVTPAQAQAVIPRLPTLYDEPFADSSQIPTFLVSELARRQVTVILSGDGGDEVFGGYNRYFLGHRIWNGIKWMPTSVRKAGGSILSALSPQTWNLLFRGAGPVLPNRITVQHPGDKLQKLADALTMEDPRTLYWGLISLWKNIGEVVPGSREPLTIFNEPRLPVGSMNFLEQMMFMDTLMYLPDDILAKVDRASMGVSLEARVPILDHRIVEFGWQIPVSMKIRYGQGKWILRKVLDRYVPIRLIDRPKMGFGVPIDSWLRGPLRDWSETLLDERRLRTGGFLNPRPIRQKWSEHLSGRRNWQYLLWCILMFQAWLEEQDRSVLGAEG